MRKILLISGKQRSGKDTFAKISTKYGFKLAPFAGSLKKEVSAAIGISLQELEDLKNSTAQYRNILISWAEMRKTFDKGYFVRKALTQEGNISIPDFRFYEELNLINSDKSLGEVITIRVNCADAVRAIRGTLSNQSDRSETEMDSLVADYTIDNNGTYEEFEAKCVEVLENILSKESPEQNLAAMAVEILKREGL